MRDIDKLTLELLRLRNKLSLFDTIPGLCGIWKYTYESREGWSATVARDSKVHDTNFFPTPLEALDAASHLFEENEST